MTVYGTPSSLPGLHNRSPSLRAAGLTWLSVEFYIEKHDSSGVTVTRFYFDKPHVFETQEAAIEAAVAAAREKIDAGFTPPLKDAVA